MTTNEHAAHATDARIAERIAIIRQDMKDEGYNGVWLDDLTWLLYEVERLQAELTVSRQREQALRALLQKAYPYVEDLSLRVQIGNAVFTPPADLLTATADDGEATGS